MVLHPEQFDPNRFSQVAEETYGELGLEPRFRSMMFGRRAIPAIHHEFSQEHRSSPRVPASHPGPLGPNRGLSVNSAYFMVPHESGHGLTVTVDTDPSRVYKPHFAINGWHGNEFSEYQGPEHLLDAIHRHTSDLEDQIRKGWISTDWFRDDRGNPIHTDSRDADPSAPLSARWLDDTHGIKDFKLIRGRMDPSRNYMFHEKGRKGL